MKFKTVSLSVNFILFLAILIPSSLGIRNLANQTNSSICGNSLLSNAGKVGIINGLETSAYVTGLNYCTFLNNNQSCCNATDINNISFILNNIQNEIANQMKFIDINYVDSRNKIKNYTEALSEMIDIAKRITKDLLESFYPTNESIVEGFPTVNSFAFPNISQISKLLELPENFINYNKRTKVFNTTFDNKSEPIDAFLNNLKGLNNVLDNTFPTYLKNRKRCFDHLIKTYSKFYCLGCNTDTDSFYFLSEVGSSKLPKLKIHTNSCVVLMKECYDYISTNELISGFQYNKTVVDISNVTNLILTEFRNLEYILNSAFKQIKSIINDKSKINQTLELANDAINKTANITNIINQLLAQNKRGYYRYSEIPETCKDSDSCPIICENFLTKKGIDLTTSLNSPGKVKEARLLINENDISDSNGVRFTDKGYVLENIISGVENIVNVPENPAGVETKGNKDSGNYSNKLTFGIIIIAILNFFN